MAQGWSVAKVLPGNTSLHCQLSVNGVQPAGGEGAANGECRLISPDLSLSLCECV